MIIVVVVLNSAARVRADAETTLSAKQRFDAGVEAYRRGGRAEALADYETAQQEYRRAVEEYKTSYAADPQPSTMYALGQVYLALRELELALHAYRQYLVEAPPT